jgi:hypothetical protein
VARNSRFDELVNLPFSENRATKETAQTLREELLFQRAVQTHLWALPLINTLGMKVGSEKVFGAVSLPTVLTFAEGILEHSVAVSISQAGGYDLVDHTNGRNGNNFVQTNFGLRFAF